MLIMKRILALSLVIITIGIVGLSMPHLAHAVCGDPTAQNQSIQNGLNCGTSPTTVPVAIQRTINILLYITGIISIIVVIVGGLRYVLSGGDPKNTAAAKDTILYAVIGLVVSLLAYAIVNFVLAKF